MTQDEIIEMAKQAGFHLNMWQLSLGCEASGTLDELEAFAKLVAQHDREACANACEEAKTNDWEGAMVCAEVIRARGNNK